MGERTREKESIFLKILSIVTMSKEHSFWEVVLCSWFVGAGSGKLSQKMGGGSEKAHLPPGWKGRAEKALLNWDSLPPTHDVSESVGMQELKTLNRETLPNWERVSCESCLLSCPTLTGDSLGGSGNAFGKIRAS